MNRHVLAALFSVFFLLLTVPLLLMQHSGVANASLTAGFILPLDNKIHCLCLLVVGCVAAILAREMIVLLPICGLIMLLLGALAKVESTSFPEVQEFTVGAILLFSLAMSMMRRKASLASIVPVATWAYFTGGLYMAVLPAGTKPLFFLLGIVVSAAFLMAIGVALAITLAEAVKNSFGKVRAVSAVASFLSLL